MSTRAFSISGEFITDLARTHLREGNPSKAFDLIAGCLIGISMDQSAEVLCGRKKLEGTNNISMVDDDPNAPEPIAFMTGLLKQADEGNRVMSIVQPLRGAAGLCHMAYNAPRGLTGAKKNGSPAGLISEEVAKQYCGASTDRIPGLLMKLFPKFTEKEHEEFFEKNGEELYDLVSEVHPWTRTPATEARAAVSPESRKRIEEIVQKSPPMPTPTDIKKHDNGWLSPDGKFYACNYSGHEKLAVELGKGGKELEALGWIHISFGGIGSIIRAIMKNTEKDATQAQINRVFDYCEATKCELPDWAGGEGSGFTHY